MNTYIEMNAVTGHAGDFVAGDRSFLRPVILKGYCS
jgi:hypothetical protein